MWQAVKQALVETVTTELSGKKLDEAVVEYVGDAALFQLRIKGTLMAIKVIDDPAQWNPRVSHTLLFSCQPHVVNIKTYQVKTVCCAARRISDKFGSLSQLPWQSNLILIISL